MRVRECERGRQNEPAADSDMYKPFGHIHSVALVCVLLFFSICFCFKFSPQFIYKINDFGRTKPVKCRTVTLISLIWFFFSVGLYQMARDLPPLCVRNINSVAQASVHAATLSVCECMCRRHIQTQMNKNNPHKLDNRFSHLAHVFLK